MDRDLLSHLPVVRAVARRGGFAAAAGELGTSASAVSHAVRLVEDRLGAQLFARTTRSVRLTEAGEAFLARIGRALDDLGAAAEALQEARGRVTGHLRQTVPHLALGLELEPVLVCLAEAHPELVVEVRTDNALADIVADGFDAGVRIGPGIAQDMVALPLTGRYRTVLVAAPGYLARRGRPRSVADLAAHNCIGYRMLTSGRLYRWELMVDGRETEVETAGTVIVSEMADAIGLAAAGIGIAYAFEPVAAAAIAEGRLVEILPETSVIEEPLHLYYPRRASMAPKPRAFVEAVRALGLHRRARTDAARGG